jgi:hypothetical protein
MPQDAPAHPQHHGTMPVNQRLKCNLLASGQEPLQQLAVRQVPSGAPTRHLEELLNNSIDPTIGHGLLIPIAAVRALYLLFLREGQFPTLFSFFLLRNFSLARRAVMGMGNIPAWSGFWTQERRMRDEE